MVVIAIIAVLLSILLPSISRARDQAKVISCLSNLRQLTAGWIAFSIDKKGTIPNAMTGAGCWVDNGDTEPAVKNGTLFKYVNDVSVYKCPADLFDRYRSYSMNEYWGGTWGGGYQHVTKLRDTKADPSQTFVFIEELDFRGYNMGSFVIGVYPSWVWIDYPAIYHSRSTTFSFADGHAELWKWTDPRTSEIKSNNVSTVDNADIRDVQRALGFTPQGFRM